MRNNSYHTTIDNGPFDVRGVRFPVFCWLVGLVFKYCSTLQEMLGSFNLSACPRYCVSS